MNGMSLSVLHCCTSRSPPFRRHRATWYWTISRLASLRSCCQTCCACENDVAQRLKILMYRSYTSVFLPSRTLFSLRSRQFYNSF